MEILLVGAVEGCFEANGCCVEVIPFHKTLEDAVQLPFPFIVSFFIKLIPHQHNYNSDPNSIRIKIKCL